ncbi:MAG: PQQ-dependent sugar dehydrogenase [Bacteroidetes bacterium]|nr:PQQ-dependent sugar dehydrogenase [Bacteroidota bacterium]
MRFIFICILLCFYFEGTAQIHFFERKELAPTLEIPWDIEFGPDGNLWLSESQGRISKVNPNTGEYHLVWKAPDYRDPSISEQWPLCYKPMPGSGCLGLALDPDFQKSHELYLLYSYWDSSNLPVKTAFKIVLLRLDEKNDTVIFSKNMVLQIPTGFDHLGGRMLCVNSNGKKYLFVSTGDNGISETSQPSCYSPQSTNPNNQAWNPLTKNGKILRYYADGSIPNDNPLAGNPFYTRGHRNPQGLAWNSEQHILYETEHGDRTDDEINILQSGMNYGWKWVRGWHADNNWSGEEDSVNQYQPYPGITGDHLVEPIYVWCADPQPLSNSNADWCTVAPSGACWYGQGAISILQNSLLVTTLKNGDFAKQEVYAFRMNKDGKSLIPSNSTIPNPLHLFTEDANINGRIRDIALSPDGRKIFIINNGGFGSGRDKITVYTYVKKGFQLHPNPAERVSYIQWDSPIMDVKITDVCGREATEFTWQNNALEFNPGLHGIYFVKVKDEWGNEQTGKLMLR